MRSLRLQQRQANLQFGTTMDAAYYNSTFNRSGCSQISQKAVPCSAFPILVGKFSYRYCGRKSSIFPQVCDQNFIFRTKHYLMLRLHGVKFHDVPCDAVMTRAGNIVGLAVCHQQQSMGARRIFSRGSKFRYAKS